MQNNAKWTLVYALLSDSTKNVVENMTEEMSFQFMLESSYVVTNPDISW